MDGATKLAKKLPFVAVTDEAVLGGRTGNLPVLATLAHQKPPLTAGQEANKPWAMTTI